MCRRACAPARRLAVTLRDDVALERVINVPKRQLGLVSVKKLRDFAQAQVGRAGRPAGLGAWVEPVGWAGRMGRAGRLGWVHGWSPQDWRWLGKACSVGTGCQRVAHAWVSNCLRNYAARLAAARRG